MQTAARVFRPLAKKLAGRGPPPGPGGRAGKLSSTAHAPPTRYNAAANAQRILQSTRTALSNVIEHLVGPAGYLHPVEGVSLARAYERTSRPLVNGLSPSARYALGRPMGRPFLPRAPGIQRGMHDVGLGSARQFSTGRTVFHHVVENTSITTRAFLEADWDTSLKREQAMRNKRRQRKGKENKITSSSTLRLQPTPKKVSLVESVVDETEDLARFFPITSTTSPVVTYLQVALAPTPTARLPYSVAQSDHRLLPLRALLSAQSTFQSQASYVSRLFERLDETQVWEKGACVETWGDSMGLCTELRVRFEGWTESEVRSMLYGVLDDYNDSWAIQEIREGPSSLADSIPDSMMASLMSSPVLQPLGNTIHADEDAKTVSEYDYALDDPWASPPPTASSFIMPVLELSSSSLPLNSPSLSPQTPTNETLAHFNFDQISDASSFSDFLDVDVTSEWNESDEGSVGSMDNVPSVLSLDDVSSGVDGADGGYRDAISISSWIGFSSRVGEENEFFTG